MARESEHPVSNESTRAGNSSGGHLRATPSRGTDIGTLAQTNRQYDALVIGAGPAGSASAISMARSGMRVLLVESAQFPRWKVCGCCLGTLGQSVLNELGLQEALDDLEAEHLQTTELWWNGRHARLSGGGMRVVSRCGLDTALMEKAAEYGVHTAAGWRAKVEDAGDASGRMARVRLTSTSDRSNHLVVRSNAVVHASGLGSTDGCGYPKDRVDPKSLIGLGVASRDVPGWLKPGVLKMICSPVGYVGCVVDECSQAVWGAAVLPGVLRDLGSPEAAVRRILEHAKLPSDAIPRAQWKGTPLLTRKSQACLGRTYKVGDALGYVEPVTGEGMSWAMLTGTACGALIARTHDNGAHHTASVREEWSVRSRQLMRLRRARCMLISRAVRSGLLMNMLTGLPTGVLNAWPALFTHAIGGVHSAVKKQGRLA